MIPLRRFEDERGWFYELRRESLLPKPTRQTNVSFSRQGVIRGRDGEDHPGHEGSAGFGDPPRNR